MREKPAKAKVIDEDVPRGTSKHTLAHPNDGHYTGSSSRRVAVRTPAPDAESALSPPAQVPAQICAPPSRGLRSIHDEFLEMVKADPTNSKLAIDTHLMEGDEIPELKGYYNNKSHKEQSMPGSALLSAVRGQMAFEDIPIGVEEEEGDKYEGDADDHDESEHKLPRTRRASSRNNAIARSPGKSYAPSEMHLSKLALKQDGEDDDDEVHDEDVNMEEEDDEDEYEGEARVKSETKGKSKGRRSAHLTPATPSRTPKKHAPSAAASVPQGGYKTPGGGAVPVPAEGYAKRYIEACGTPGVVPKTDKTKGLRHFSLRVMQKVRGVT